MVEVIDTLEVCTDCLMIIANDDASGMNAVDERRTRAGIRCIELRTGGHLDTDGEELGFSWRECECCGGLAGDRFRAILLGEVSR